MTNPQDARTLTRLSSIFARPVAALLLLWSLGCGPAVEVSIETETSGNGAGSDTSTSMVPGTPLPSSTAATTSPMPPPLETTSTSSGTTAADPFDDPCYCGVICHDFCPPEGCPGHDPECGPSIECNVFDQDCPFGEKCMPRAKGDSLAWNATRCFPIDPDPDHVGEPCTIEGSATSGVDSCGLAELCFYVDADGNGTCVSFCGGSEEEPVCPKGQACSVTNEGVLTLCLAACDPLLPSCAEGEGCFPVGFEFVCLPTSSDAIVTPGTCYPTGGCEPGTACVNPKIVPDCEDETGCCTRWCDLTGAQCPPNTECLPWFEMNAPPEFETLEICASLP